MKPIIPILLLISAVLVAGCASQPPTAQQKTADFETTLHLTLGGGGDMKNYCIQACGANCGGIQMEYLSSSYTITNQTRSIITADCLCKCSK